MALVRGTWVALAVGVLGSAVSATEEPTAWVTLGSGSPTGTWKLTICRLYDSTTVPMRTPRPREECGPYVAIKGHGRVEFERLAGVVFAPTKALVHERRGEHAVQVEVVLRNGQRLRGLLDREEADTLSLVGEKLQVHLSTEEWVGVEIRVSFPEVPGAG